MQRPLVFSLRVYMDLGAGFGVSEWAECWPGLPLHAHRDLGVGLETFGNCAGLQVEVGEFLDCLLFAVTSPGVQWCGCGSLLHVGGMSVTRGGGRLAEVRVDACGVLFSCSRSILCTCICTCMYAAWAWASRGGGRVAEVRVGVLVVLLGSALALFISFIFCYTLRGVGCGPSRGATRARVEVQVQAPYFALWWRFSYENTAVVVLIKTGELRSPNAAYTYTKHKNS